MYDMFYNKIRKAYGENTKLLYSDTDSFIIQINGMHSFMEGIKHEALQGFVDTSNFPSNPLHPLYSTDYKGKLGAIKSETSVHPIKQFVGLSPKCYSLKLHDDSSMATSKGVNSIEQRNITHEHYRRMLHNQENTRVSCQNIVWVSI